MLNYYSTFSDELPAYLKRYWLTNLANFSALAQQHIPDLNWVGFYLVRGGQLELGPFQGKPACLTISFERGVCGTAARERKVQIVDDVHSFAGHIACDSASKSELVVPLLLGDRLLGVLDLDSPKLARFTPADAAAVTELARKLINGTDWPTDFE
jgi:L-methionine (R)-S-oxide reductase